MEMKLLKENIHNIVYAPILIGLYMLDPPANINQVQV